MDFSKSMRLRIAAFVLLAGPPPAAAEVTGKSDSDSDRVPLKSVRASLRRVQGEDDHELIFVKALIFRDQS